MGKSYWEKLNHPLWQKRRLEILSRDAFCCVDCGSDDKKLNAHHRYYISERDPWEYPDWALSSLCDECHDKAHAGKRYLWEFIIQPIYTLDKDDIYSLCEKINKCRGVGIHDEIIAESFLRALDQLVIDYQKAPQ